MEKSYALLVFISIAALAFISKTLFNNKSKRRSIPPGPKPWPIIGNLNLISTSNLHLSFHLLSQKYGEIMHLKFLSSTVIVVSSAEMAKQFLKTHDSVFASRAPFAAGKYTSYNYSNILWAPYGPYWRHARKITISEFLSSNKLELFEHIRVEERHNFVSRLHGLSGEPIVIRDHVARHILSTIWRMVLGDECYTAINLDRLEGIVDEWLQLNGAFNFGDWMPWLSFADLQGFLKKMKALTNKYDSFFDSCTDARSRKDSATKDGIDVLLKLAEDPNQEVKLTKDHIKAIIQDILVAAKDTTTMAIEWAIHEIMKNPRIMKEAKQELDRVVGRNRWVSESDLSQLPYFNAIIMETMRFHPPTTLLPPHYATDDCNVAGYDIPKGAKVMINAWSVGRDPKTWDSPMEFIPERFLDTPVVDMLGTNFGLLPFGAGRRMCPAYNLGLINIRSTLANLLHGFNWKLPGSMKPEDVCMEEEEKYSLLTRPKLPVTIIMESTLPFTYIGNN